MRHQATSREGSAGCVLYLHCAFCFFAVPQAINRSHMRAVVPFSMKMVEYGGGHNKYKLTTLTISARNTETLSVDGCEDGGV